MHGQLKIALKEVLKGALQQLLLEAGPFESFSKKSLWKHYLCYFLALSCYWYNLYPAEKHIQTVQIKNKKLKQTLIGQEKTLQGPKTLLGFKKVWSGKSLVQTNFCV